MMVEYGLSAIPEHTDPLTEKMHALRVLAAPLIGHAVEGEKLARMIERVTRKDVAMPDLQAELDRLYAEKS